MLSPLPSKRQFSWKSLSVVIMASGFGYAGTISTCYKPFEDFTLCMVRSECAMDKLT
jgi:hypothetical protein